MRVELHDGNYAELREQLTAGDRRSAKAAIAFTITDDGSRTITAELEENVYYALLRRMIVLWSFPQPIPRDAVDWQGALDALDIGDLEALAAAAKPHYDRIMSGPKAPAETAVPGSVLSISSLDEPEQSAP